MGQRAAFGRCVSYPRTDNGVDHILRKWVR